MHPYLSSTQHATQELFHILTEGKVKLHSLMHQQFQIMRDANTKGTGFRLTSDKRWALVDNIDRYTPQQIRQLEDNQNRQYEIRIDMDGKEESLAAISMSILQIAKQGISSVYGKQRSKTLQLSPQVRDICDMPIQQIIWDGRNHALHYEESPNHKQPIIETFDRLEGIWCYEVSLKDNPSKSLALRVMEILSWDSYDKYLNDMKQLLSPTDDSHS